MKKSQARLVCALVLVTVVYLGQRAAVMGAAPPNILVIMTDDQGWWDLGVHGNPHIHTPRMDQLCSEGIDRFYPQYCEFGFILVESARRAGNFLRFRL